MKAHFSSLRVRSLWNICSYEILIVLVHHLILTLALLEVLDTYKGINTSVRDFVIITYNFIYTLIAWNPNKGTHITNMLGLIAKTLSDSNNMMNNINCSLEGTWKYYLWRSSFIFFVNSIVLLWRRTSPYFKCVEGWYFRLLCFVRVRY